MKTILIVDDEPVLLEGLKRILSHRGYRVLTAQNGVEALDTLRSEYVHVVLCDLKMPVMGAVEVLDEVRVTYPDLPVIIITGHGTNRDAIECLEKKAYEFVVKPFQVDYVLSVIRCAIEKLPPPPRLQERQF